MHTPFALSPNLLSLSHSGVNLPMSERGANASDVVAADASAAGGGADSSSWCLHARSALGVQPGQSWGQLDEPQIREWKRRRCDQFFCAPSEMEAKGKYRCVPLATSAR